MTSGGAFARCAAAFKLIHKTFAIGNRDDPRTVCRVCVRAGERAGRGDWTFDECTGNHDRQAAQLTLEKKRSRGFRLAGL
jgi:hypothetical protein